MSIAQLLSTNVDPLLTAELLDVFIQPGGRSGHGGISPWWFSLGWWWKTVAPWTHYWRLLPYLECVRSCHLRGGGQIRSLIVAVERSATQEFKQWCRGPKYHQLSKANIPTYSKFKPQMWFVSFIHEYKWLFGETTFIVLHLFLVLWVSKLDICFSSPVPSVVCRAKRPAKDMAPRSGRSPVWSKSGGYPKTAKTTMEN